MGEPEIDAEQMYRFVAARNPEFPREIAEAFYEIGRRYGVRGDIALCQSILETGWFRFTGGTAVTFSQNNFCGLGVTQLGLKGHSFPTVEEGVTAQIQHLYAYATSFPLPKGEKLVDPRFSRVMRGIAPTWSGLNRRWAANDHYADRIMGLFADMVKFQTN
ncbi:MAG: glucosaminidase domain-containing protein [Bacteroides sp.]|nr:glucosaminidase domain-containing protein [Bacteroides sp.]